MARCSQTQGFSRVVRYGPRSALGAAILAAAASHGPAGRWVLLWHTFSTFDDQVVQVGNGIELDTVGLQFEPYPWRPCGVTVTWDVVPEQSW